MLRAQDLRAKVLRSTLPPRRRRRRRRPDFEALESRQILSTVYWNNPDGGNWDSGANWSTGQTPGQGDTAVINTAATAIITIQSGDNIQVQSIMTGSTDTLSITGGALTVTAGDSTLSGSLSMTGGSLTASGSGVNLTASTTTVSAASLYAEEGATLSLPRMASYASDNNTFFQADGANSVLDVSALTNVTVAAGHFLANKATDGGTLNLGGLTSLTVASGSRISLRDPNRKNHYSRKNYKKMRQMSEQARDKNA